MKNERYGTSAAETRTPAHGPRRPRRRRHRRRLASAVGALAAVVLTGCQQWGPVESSYQGTVRVSASGTAFVEDGQRVVNGIKLEDVADDGNTVYARTKAYWYKEASACTSPPCGATWQAGQTRVTDEIEDEIQTFRHSFPLDALADRVRLRVQACAQMGWPVPDSCGDEPAIATFSY